MIEQNNTPKEAEVSNSVQSERRARSPFSEEFFKAPDGSPLGLRYEAYTQLDEVGYTAQRTKEARSNRELEGKIIAVVGAKENGIGGFSLLEAASQGATVIGVARQTGGSESTERLMSKASNLSGSESLWLSQDMTERGASTKVIDRIVKRYGRIDGLVLAAAQIDDKALVDFNEDELRSLFEVNFWSNVLMLKDTLRQMLDQKYGRVVFVSSVSGARSMNQPGYGSAKAAVDNIIKSIPLEFFRKGDVAGNSIAPGFARTSMTDVVDDKQERVLNKLLTAERSLLPQEVAEPIVHLLNPNTSANGKIIPIVGRGETPEVDEETGLTIR